MKSISKFYNIIFFIFILQTQIVHCTVKLPELISDGMILQRDIPIKIWGWASSGEEIVLKFKGNSYKTVADNKGNWLVILPPQNAGGPFNLSINATNKIVVNNILFGDVWLCSGQSNMEYPFNRLKDKYADEIKNSKNNKIRQFKIPADYNFDGPQSNFKESNWEEASPDKLLNFSAVAYFFAKELYDKYKVPVGIINASLGGSPAEAWMSKDALKDFPDFILEADKYSDTIFVNKLIENEQKAIYEWYSKLNRLDDGLHNSPDWKSPLLDDSFWNLMNVPGYWADYGNDGVNGVVWFRRTIGIPQTMAGKSARLFMGRIIDADSVFINGIFIGTTGYQYPQRDYIIPEGILKKGVNTIVVRVISNQGRGGFVEDKPYKIFTENDTINLVGEWYYKIGCKMEATPGQTFINWKPTGLYNAMIAPSENYKIKGVVWYQGESNTDNPEEYMDLLCSLIEDWRLKRGQGDFPFIIAQLPNFMKAKREPSESKWAEFRFIQYQITQLIDNMAISVNIDIGEWNDIHPQNKLDISKRLALAARKIAYNEDNLVAAGPVIKSIKKIGNKIELTFTDCGSGIITIDGRKPCHFAVAGKDGVYYWAETEIKGDIVIVYSKKVNNPESVRYAWADNPEGANLYNVEGLPAMPFCATVNKKRE